MGGGGIYILMPFCYFLYFVFLKTKYRQNPKGSGELDAKNHHPSFPYAEGGDFFFLKGMNVIPIQHTLYPS